MSAYRLRNSARERALRYVRRHAMETGPCLAASVTCTNCGAPNMSGWTTCIGCGASL